MAGGIRRGGDTDAMEENHEINITPFIDVILVLLIIFMVAAPLATVDVNVDLPASTATPQPRPSEPIYLTVKRDLGLALGNEDVTREGVGAALARSTNGDREARIFLRADEAVAYGDLMEVMNILRGEGYLKVALVGLEAAPATAVSPGTGAMTAGGDAHPTHSVGDYAHAIGRNQGREAILWAGAATLVLALHAGVAAWALHRRVEPAGLAVPPGAVMIDLAPEPEAPVAEESQISEQLEDVAPSETREPVVPTPEESMETVDAPDPIEDIPPTEEPPAEQAEIAPLESPVPDEQTVELPEVERAEVVLPPKRPAIVKKAEDVRKEVAAPPKKAPPPESVRATAKPVSSAAGTAKWQTRLMAHLERRKRYPPALKRDRIEGVARVRFSVDTAGNVTSVSLARSSGVPELDAEVVAMVRRASPVPTPPPGATLNITVPVSFTIR